MAEMKMAKLEQELERTSTGNLFATSVQGTMYVYYVDLHKRNVIAYNTETEEFKTIHFGTKVDNDLMTRKQIAKAFGLASFRK